MLQFSTKQIFFAFNFCKQYNNYMHYVTSIKKYTTPGDQTKIGPNTKKTADSIFGEGLQYIANVLDWTLTNLERENSKQVKNKVFRRRTAEEILKSGFVTGCTDSALVVIAICRTKGIPTKYVEAIEKSWLEEKRAGGLRGHVFAECFINNKWYQIDPARGLIYSKQNYSKYEILGRGLDSWDLEIRDFESLEKKFNSFKNTSTKTPNTLHSKL